MRLPSALNVVVPVGSAYFRATATLWLLIRGGPQVGKNLNLLSAYYPGYSVTWTGSLIGFCYGALTGAALGWCVAWFYNVLADWRAGSR